jgi:uncharacterized protein
MTTPDETAPLTSSSLLARHPALVYFLATFAISWVGALLLVAPQLLHGEPIPKFTGLMMFPMMLLGPSVSGIFLTGFFDGRAGLREFLSRLSPSRISARWLTVLLIPPICVLAVLFALTRFLSATYVPNHFFVGAGFGIVAGFFEELGWTGFALPKMLSLYRGWLPSAILLGILWGCWHIPVIDYLGTATPHGSAWLPFFFAFTAAMTAIRVLIVWLYTKTQSVLLAQLMHAFSTASLVVFSPVAITPRQEAFWYFLYAAALWVLILFFFATGRFKSR